MRCYVCNAERSIDVDICPFCGDVSVEVMNMETADAERYLYNRGLKKREKILRDIHVAMQQFFIENGSLTETWKEIGDGMELFGQEIQLEELFCCEAEQDGKVKIQLIIRKNASSQKISLEIPVPEGDGDLGVSFSLKNGFMLETTLKRGNGADEHVSISLMGKS